MRLFVITMICVAVLGCFVMAGNSASVEACGGMTTIAPPPFDPVPTPPDDTDPFNTEIDEVIL